jgi:acyl dehydratase
MIHRVRAVNEPGSANPVHDDEFARRMGFRGGLVPGATVYGYMAVLPERQWGDQWLAGGTMAARFLAPFYDGEEVAVTATSSEAGLDLEARNPAGELCASGRASPTSDEPAPDVDRYPAPPPPEERRPPLSVREGEALGVFRAALRLEPAWPARLGNHVLMASVALPPWIHVETRTRHLSAVRNGEAVEVRALVAGAWERRGHHFVDLDVLVLGEGGRPAAHLRHVAIVQLASRSASAG